MMVSEVTSSSGNWWSSIRRNWLIATLTTATVFGGVAYLVLRDPLYQTQSLILIGNKVSVPVVQSEESGSNTVKEKSESLLNDIEVLKSQSLLSKAIKKLDAPYNAISPDLIAKNLRLIQPEGTTVLSVSYEDTNPLRAKAVLDALVATYLNYGRDSQRSPVTNAVQFIEKKLPQAQAELEKSSRELTNFRVRNNIGDGEAAINLAYTQKENFRDKVIEAELNLHQTQQQYQALQGQINGLQQDSKTLLADAILSQDSTYQSVLKQLQALNIQYQTQRAMYTPDHPKTKLLKEQIDELNQLLAQSSRQIIGTKKSQIADRKIENGEILQGLGSQLSQLQMNLLTQQKQLPKLRQEEKIANLDLDRLLKRQQVYQTLQRREALNIQTVEGFTKKLQELRIREAQETSTWKVIEPPTLAMIPSAKNGNRGLILALLAGILSGTSIALWLDQFERRFRDIEELKQMVNLPLLGLIPRAQGQVSVFKNSQIGLLNKSSRFTEAMRSFALSLAYQVSNQRPQVMAIASARTGEGTTTIAYNLGLTLAEIGKRVLIVDANLTDPQLHKVFSLSNDQGLTTAIATDLPWQSLIQSASPEHPETPEYAGQDRDFSLRESINGTGSHSNSSSIQLLTASPAMTTSTMPPIPQHYPDILTAGPAISSSFLWLVSPKMDLMLNQWRKVYDYILIDTPAVSELADAQGIIPKVDEVIYVVNLKRSERVIVLDTLEILRRSHSPIAGVLVNNAE